MPDEPRSVEADLHRVGQTPEVAQLASGERRPEDPLVDGCRGGPGQAVIVDPGRDRRLQVELEPQAEDTEKL